MNFEYKGKLVAGGKAKGKLEADSRGEALRELRKRGVVPLSLGETSTLNKDIRFKKKLKNADFVMFLRQFATLINAGISISEATQTMAEQVENRGLQEALEDIDKQVGRGEALSTAASRHDKIFPELLVNMLYAGETSGRLDDILSNMADYYEKQHKNHRKMVSSMMYPGAVGVVAVALTIFLLTYIVPTFTAMFNSLGEDIPAYTLFIMSLSDMVRAYWWAGVIFLVLAVFAGKYSTRYARFMYKIDGWKLKIPLIGNLLHKSMIVRMTRTLSMLLDASIPVLQALEITERVASNRIMKSILIDMREVLRGGGEMSSVMTKHWLFPSLLVQMVQVGEKTGSLDSMLKKVTDFYEEEVDQLSERFGSLVEPFMIVFLAFIVGAIVMAIIIPMFSMYQSI